VSLANIIGYDIGFILRGKVVHTVNRGPRIDPWGTHVSMHPSWRKNSELF
jgi:hypothetical protein